MKNFSETIFDGEKYISSKQAALLANYTSDYIGQLCRGNKIKARRIGRDWFVSEANLISYQNKLSGIEEQVEIKIRKEPVQVLFEPSRNNFQHQKESDFDELRSKNYELSNKNLNSKFIIHDSDIISRESRLPEVDDIYSFDISSDFSEKKKDFHLKELYSPKVAEQKFNFKSISRKSRLPEEALAKAGQSDINLFKIFTLPIGHFLLTLTKINSALADWIEDRRYNRIKNQELRIKDRHIHNYDTISRQSRLPEFIKILAPIGVVGGILGVLVLNPAFIFEKGEKLVKNGQEIGKSSATYIVEAPAKMFELGYKGIMGIEKGVNGIAKVVDYSINKKPGAQITQSTKKAQKQKNKNIQNYFKEISAPYEGEVLRSQSEGRGRAQVFKSEIFSLPFSTEDLKNAFFAIPETLVFARDNIKTTFGMIGEEAKLLSQKIFFGAKTFVQDFIKRKPLAKKEEPGKQIVIQYSPSAEPVSPVGETSKENFQLASENQLEETSIIRKILGRLSLVESRAGVGQISANDLAAINANIRADTKILIDSAISGIEKRIPPIAQNPVVFLTSSVPGPTSSSPPQVGSGISAAFGEFSESLGTSGDFKASGNVTLGDAAKNTSIKSKTWNITSGGAGSGFVSFESETLTVSSGASISGGLTAYGVSSFSSNLGIGTTTPGSILSVDQVGNFVASATSSLFYGLTVPGIHATSSGITISGGSILNTSTATSTFSGGIGLTSLSASNGLTISGGDILYEGALFRLTSGGNLGIGTTSPTSKLSVHNGGALISGTTTVQHLFATSTLMVGSSVGVGDRFMVKQSGEVSIGSTTPFAFLAVENTGSALSFAVNDQAADASPFVVDANGNVGIGTSSPVTTLDMVQRANGEVMFRGRRFTDTAPTGDLFQITTADGNTNLFRIDNSGNITGGGVISSGAISILSTSQPQLRVQYDASNEVTTSVTSAGVTTYGFNGTTPTGTWTPQTNSTNTFSFTNAASASILSIDTTNQRVGISSTTPASKLSVQGNALIAGTTTVQHLFATSTLMVGSSTGVADRFIVMESGNVGVGTTTPSGLLSVSGGLTTPAFILNQTSTGDLMSLLDGGSSAFIVKDGGNVGVGTANPGTKFHITSGGNTEFRIDTTATDLNSVLSFYENAADKWSLANVGASSDMLRFTSGSVSNVLTLAQGGNIGIGTASPIQALHVAGQGYFSNDLTIAGNEINLGTGAGTTTVSGGFSGLGIATTTPGGQLSVTSTGTSTALLVSNQGTNYSFYVEDASADTSPFVIDAAGNVGIGTTGPGAPLDVQTSGTGTRIIGRFERTAAFDTNLLVKNSTATDGRSVSLILSGKNAAATQSNVSIEANTQTGANADMYFRTGGSDETVGSTRMTILGDGNVGIGTTTANRKLVVAHGSTDTTVTDLNNATMFLSNPYTTNDNYAGLEFNSFDTGGTLRNGAMIAGIFSSHTASMVQTELGFYTRNISGTVNNAMRIDENGNVGIGTTGPASALDVNKNGAGIQDTVYLTNTQTAAADVGSQLSFNGATVRMATIQGAWNGAATTDGYLAFTTRRSNSLTDAMRITSDGNVGIGTTSPQFPLAIQSNSSSNTLQIIGRSNGSTDEGTITFTDNDGITQAYLQTAGNSLSIIPYTSGNLILGAGAAEKVRITSDGNVGIGTTNPLQALHVAGQGYFSNDLTIWGNEINLGTGAGTTTVSGGFSGLGIATTTPGGQLSVAVASGTSTALLVSNLGSNYTAYFEDSSADTSPFVIDAGGNVGIGNANPVYPLTFGAGVSAGTVSSGGNLDQVIAGSIGSEIIGHVSTTNDAVFGTGGSGNNILFTRWTGSTNSELMRINTSGNVGIGTTNPLQALHVAGQGYFSNDLSIWGNEINLGTGAGTTTVSGGFSGLGIATTTPGGQLSVAVASGTSTALLVSNLGSNYTAYFEDASADTSPFVIDAAGNVGIGTAGPSDKLHVTSDTSVSVYLEATAAGDATYRSLNPTRQFSFGVRNDLTNKFAIRDVTGNTDRLIIDLSGNVGIGTTSPWALLSVEQASGASGENVFVVGDEGTSTPSLIVKGNGNVGIGTTSPGTLLDVDAAGNFGGGLSALIASDLSETGDVCITASNTFSRETDGGCDASALRFKEDISDITYGLAELMQLKPKFYRFKEEFKGDFTLMRGGFIAEEVASIIPEAAEYEGYLNGEGVGLIENYDVRAVTAVIAKAVQEMNNKFSDNFELAEMQAPEAGDLVMFEGQGSSVQGQEIIEKATSTQKAIGVLTSVSASSSPVAFTGQTLVKVSDENGEIKAGDKITLSSISGIGALATTSGQTVGIALENFEGQGASVQGQEISTIINSQGREVRIGKIKVFINLGYSELGARDKGQGASTLDFFTLNNNPFTLDQQSGKVVSSYSIDLNGKDLLNVRAILSQSGLWSIGDDGKILVQEIVTEKLGVRSEVTLGSAEKRIGITLYDEASGDPYCLKVSGGATITTSGVCGTVAPEPPPPQSGETSTTTPPVSDTEAPQIQIIGDNPATIPVGSTYSDNGAIVTDNIDENLGYQTYLNGSLVTQIQLDTSTTTTHSIEYHATDQAGNIGSATRVVNVVNP